MKPSPHPPLLWVVVAWPLLGSLGSCGSSQPTAPTESPWQSALDLHGAGQPRAALEAYDRVLAEDPEHQGAHFNRCLLLLDLGQLHAALQAVDRALDLAPEDADALVLRARVHLTSDQPEFGLANLRRALELDPMHAEAYRVRGDAWLELGEGEAAIVDYSNALRLEPLALELLEARALAFEGLRRPAEAELDRTLATFVERVLQEPTALAPRLDLAQAYLEFGECELALAQTQWVLEQPEAPAEAWLLRGHCRWLLGEQEGALEDYTRTIESGAGAALPAYLARASVYLALGAEREALADGQAARALDPEDQEVWADLAWLLATARDASLRNGEEALDLALALGPNNEEPWRPAEVQAAAYAATGEWEQAQQSLRIAIELAEGDLRQALQQRLTRYGQQRSE